MKLRLSLIMAAVLVLAVMGGGNARADESSAATGDSAVAPDTAGEGTTAPSSGTSPGGKSRVATLATSDLRDYDSQPAEVKQLLAEALRLTTLDLSYKYGSCDPDEGGMDCSGTVYYLLTKASLKDVPRDASGMYKWVWTQGHFQAVVSSNPGTFELDRLKPGDLLFWTGTYRVDHDPPITHVMIYLGINRLTGRRVMVGASEGRRFNGKSEYGVSVFDFTMPSAKQTGASASESSPMEARFVGYGAVPGLTGN
jgi:cell wall-associated NlpC family hydrolase